MAGHQASSPLESWLASSLPALLLPYLSKPPHARMSGNSTYLTRFCRSAAQAQHDGCWPGLPSHPGLGPLSGSRVAGRLYCAVDGSLKSLFPSSLTARDHSQFWELARSSRPRGPHGQFTHGCLLSSKPARAPPTSSSAEKSAFKELGGVVRSGLLPRQSPYLKINRFGTLITSTKSLQGST